MLKKLLLTFMFLLCASVSFAGEITISWEASPEVDVDNYFVRYGTQSEVYDTNILVGNVTAYHLALVPGTYFIAVAAKDTSDNVSNNSYEIKVRIMLDPPTGLKAQSIF